jgi:glycosyltransferase involved in cell wall biosynthesis
VTPGDPEVSVCIPAFNAERWIQAAIRSALQQTHGSLEVVVVDNASTDGTRRRVQELDDARIRLYANSHNLGGCRNFNRSVALSRGRYIKFLCADDLLYPDCIEMMLSVFESDPRVGLVFSPRDIELEDPADPIAIGWKAKHERTYTHFGELHEVNEGEALLATWIGAELRHNWIGEPTNVMLSRDCLRRIGTFNVRVPERTDMDLWARAMLFHSIGFVDRPLARYLIHAESGTSINRDTGRAWLDRLWLLEGLLTYDRARRRHPEIARLRTRAFLATLRDVFLARTTPKKGKLRGIGSYLAFRLRGRRDRSNVFGTIDDQGPPGETVEVEARLVKQ